MSSIEVEWENLEAAGEVGGARRVDAVHPCDIYVALDTSGRRGLIVIADRQPSSAPRFESVEVATSHRKDGRWSLSIWLVEVGLGPIFLRLCQDIVDATREIDPDEAVEFVLARLGRWRRLLETGSYGLSASELRGLVGELVVLQRCMARWSGAEVVDAWVGPLDAPQDFAFPGMWIEAKAVDPSSTIVRINSADQLDAPGRIVLAVVTLATVNRISPGFATASLVSDIREELSAFSAAAVMDFDSKLAAAGYSKESGQDERYFRVDDVRLFEVGSHFPRLRRSDLPGGIVEAHYDIKIAACAEFEIASFE